MILQLYLHFPFCKQKCAYCDFCSAAHSAETIDKYCFSLEKEILCKGKEFAGAQVKTVFLGGGTPTVVPPAQMARVLDALHRAFDLAPDVEFTSEANPGTLTQEWLDMALQRGLNRLSLGVQAAQDHLLRSVGRIHTFQQAQQAVRLAQASGIRNLNLDAMFGLPGQTERDYLDTLDSFAALGAQHISAYSLILEEGTPLHAMVESGRVTLPPEDDVAAMYEHGIEHLAKLGYERYEVSNFARPGFACRHNLGYWQGEWYLGLGVAAHGMLPPSAQQRAAGAVRVRTANTCDLNAYIKEEIQPEVELIGADEAMFETMMLGLRTTQGVSETLFQRLHGCSMEKTYAAALQSIVRDGLGAWVDEGAARRFALTPRGIEIQNEVLLRFMDR